MMFQLCRNCGFVSLRARHCRSPSRKNSGRTSGCPSTRSTARRNAVVFGRPAAAGALRNAEVAACVVADVDPSTGLRTRLNEKELQEFCRNVLSAWQVPKRIFFVNAIPVNERGKISRRELARRFATKRRQADLGA